MKFAFRVDASLRIGSGHIARCTSLATVLSQDGHEVTFITRELPEAMGMNLRAANVATRCIPVEAGQSLASAKKQDAYETAQVLKEIRPNWLVIDNYEMDADWETTVSSFVSHTMVIDDLADRRHECCVLLDQNLFFAGADRYRNLVPDRCQLLIGPTFALLGPQFVAGPSAPRRERRSLERLLLYFGGGDTAQPLLTTLEALSDSEFRHLLVDVVATPTMSRFDEVTTAVRRRGNATLHAPQPSLAHLMGSADFTIGGSGATTWERMCVGLPSAVVVMADNQRILAHELHERGLVTNLGEAFDLSPHAIRDVLRRSRLPGALTQLADNLHAVCDGRGVFRVRDTLLSFNRADRS